MGQFLAPESPAVAPPRSGPTARPRPEPHQVGLAGLAGVGVSFGFARYAYGLFLPDIRAELDLSVSAVGLIGSVGYVGYLVALVLVGVLADRVGPRWLVTTGGIAATSGTGLVALAQSPILLAVGLVVAGSSPGWIWASYSDAVEQTVPEPRREWILALITSGTAFGVTVAGPLALLTHGSGWRYAWLAFAAGAAAATAYNRRVLPTGARSMPDRSGRSTSGLRWLATRRTVPLYATAVSYGLVGSVYWLLAVEAVSGSGDDYRTAALFWTVIGVTGMSAALVGTLFDRVGLDRSRALIFTSLAVAVALLGLAPTHVGAATASATLYGPSFMAGSALLAVWSYRVFPQRPTAGFSATVFFLALGTIIGPATLGALADHHGMPSAFLATAAVALAAVPYRRRRNRK